MKLLIICCFSLWWLFTINSVWPQRENRLTVVLDPGHGGVDAGTVGINGIKEKEVVLGVAKEVVRLNRELFNDRLNLYLTRYKDTLISLRDRSRLVKQLNADIFISLHYNHASKREVQGIEVYLQKSSEYTTFKNERGAELLAQSLMSNFDKFLGYKVRGVKHANFQVLRETQSVCPGVLVELGYLSNETEADHSTNKESLTGLALVVIQTLLDQEQ